MAAIKPDVAQALAKWIAANQPRVFEELAQQAQAHGLSGFEDIMSGIGTAVSNVGTFLTSPQGLTALTTLGGVYLQTQAQRAALNVQVKNAQAGYAPAPIRTTIDGTTGQVITTLDTAQGARPFTPADASYYLNAATLKTYIPYILIGGGLLLALFLLPSRRQAS